MWSFCRFHTSRPKLVKPGRFDLSVITGWQSTTIKRVVRSALAAQGCAVSEGLESAQWFRHHKGGQGTDSHSVANTVKKDVGQSHGKRFRIVVSRLREGFRSVENISQTWLPTHLKVADPLTKTMEKDILTAFFNQPRKPTRTKRLRKLMRIVLPRNEF